MREFDDVDGGRWVATVAEDEGVDYKGRFHMVMEGADGAVRLPLTDVRWNSAKTAGRTLSTMSLVELRRRLRLARGRDAAGVSGPG